MEKEQIFRKVIDENRDKIFRICNYYFHDDDDRDDAYQEALIRIWENLSSFKNRSQISTWIYRVTVNTCLMFIRKDKSRKRIFSAGLTSDLINLPDKAAAVEDAQADLKLSFFRKFMDEIPSVDRTLVSLYLEDLSSREMADIIGLTEANVRVKIHRIKEQINNKWKELQNGTG